MNNLRQTGLERQWPLASFHFVAFCILGSTLVFSGCGGSAGPSEPGPVEEAAPLVPAIPASEPKRDTTPGPNIAEVRVPADHAVWSPRYEGALLGLDGKVYEGYNLPTVARIQQALHDQGFYPGDVDSNFDHDTMEALADFQAEHKLKLTGVPTPLTRLALIPASPATPKAAQGFLVQVGVFSNPANSDRLTKKLKDLAFAAQVEPTEKNQQVVRVGPFEDRKSAEQTAAAIKEITGLSPLVRSF